MRSTRIIALILAVVMLAAALVGCGSAYDNPTDYLKLPDDFKKLTVTDADLKKEIADQIESLLEESAGQVFEPVNDKNATVQKGDEIYISFKGTTNADLTDTVKEKLTDDHYYLTLGSNDSTFPVDYTNKNDDKSDNDSSDEKVIDNLYGIENQILSYRDKDGNGAKVGTKLTLTGKFSNSYGTEDLKNVTVTYEIEIKAIARVFVSKDHKVKVTYTVEDKKEDIASDIEVIPAAKTTETETPETTTAPTTSDAPTSTAKKATFAELFPSVTSSSSATELDFSKTTTAFASLFTLKDLLPAFENKALYSEFALELTVPTSAADKYADYKGKNVYYVFKIESTTSTPTMSDYFINKSTINAEDEADRFATVTDYKKYLRAEFEKTLAYEAILEASTVIEMPEDEWLQSYENYLNQYVCDYLATKDSSTSGVSLDDYTPSELKAKVPEADYEELRVQASVDAQDSVKQRLTMEALFNKYNIKLSKKEYNEKMKEEEDNYNANLVTYVYYYGIYSFDQYITYFGGEEYFELQWKYKKLLDVLPEKVTIEPSTETAE